MIRNPSELSQAFVKIPSALYDCVPSYALSPDPRRVVRRLGRVRANLCRRAASLQKAPTACYTELGLGVGDERAAAGEERGRRPGQAQLGFADGGWAAQLHEVPSRQPAAQQTVQPDHIPGTHSHTSGPPNTTSYRGIF